MWMWHDRHDPVESAVDFVGDEGGPERQPAVVGLVDLSAELAAEAPVPEAVRDQTELVAAAIALVQSQGFCLLCRPPLSVALKPGDKDLGSCGTHIPEPP